MLGCVSYEGSATAQCLITVSCTPQPYQLAYLNGPADGSKPACKDPPDSAKSVTTLVPP